MRLGWVHHPQPSQLLSQPWAWSHGAQSHCRIAIAIAALKQPPAVGGAADVTAVVTAAVAARGPVAAGGTRWQRQGWFCERVDDACADQLSSQLTVYGIPRCRCPSRASSTLSVISDLFTNGASPSDGIPQPLAREHHREVDEHSISKFPL